MQAIQMNEAQMQAFAAGMAAMLIELDEDPERPVLMTAKEFGLFCLGLMLLQSFTPTALVLDSYLSDTLKKIANGGFRPIDAEEGEFPDFPDWRPDTI